MNALELIKRIEKLSEDEDGGTVYYGIACYDIVQIIKQMEKEKWENALIDPDQWSEDGIV